MALKSVKVAAWIIALSAIAVSVIALTYLLLDEHPLLKTSVSVSVVQKEDEQPGSAKEAVETKNDTDTESKPRISTMGEEMVVGFCQRTGESLPKIDRPGLSDLLLERVNQDIDEEFDRELRKTLSSVLDALKNQKPEHALNAAKAFWRRHPQRWPAAALTAQVAASLRDWNNARMALSELEKMQPDQPAVQLALGQLLSKSADLDQAASALTIYLRKYPDDIEIQRLRARLALAADLQRDFERIDRRGITLLAYPGFARSDAERLLELVDESLQHASELTGTRRREDLTVVVYAERADLLATTCVPDWATGVYDGVLRLHAQDLDPQSTGFQKVVQHECLHAQMRSVVGQTPYWFEEGLAQHVAAQFGPGHRKTFQRMLENRTYIPLASLEGPFIEFERKDDVQMAYHQGLAMVEMLIALGGRDAIHRAISLLQKGKPPPGGLMSAVLGRPVTGDDLLGFMERRWFSGEDTQNELP